MLKDITGDYRDSVDLDEANTLAERMCSLKSAIKIVKEQINS